MKFCIKKDANGWAVHYTYIDHEGKFIPYKEVYGTYQVARSQKMKYEYTHVNEDRYLNIP